MMDILNTEFRRLFSLPLYKRLRLSLAEMVFSHDFISDTRGDLYPLLASDGQGKESVSNGAYRLSGGMAKRLFCAFFPYASYELTASVGRGAVGFSFLLPNAEATLTLESGALSFSLGGCTESFALADRIPEEVCMSVSCRPGAFDVYFRGEAGFRYITTFCAESFSHSHSYDTFRRGRVALVCCGEVAVKGALSYLDNGVSVADMRPIRYENGEIMLEDGKVWLTASMRMRQGAYQGVISWVPGTAKLELTGAIFYDAGDGDWCGDVAASILYHRAEERWYLWVCSFSHGHILGHSVFFGDPRFGICPVDIKLMERAPDGAPITEFLGFCGDEDPDFFFDGQRWLMAICRKDPAIGAYRYVFFASDSPFSGYRYIGAGLDGAETGGSFVSAGGKRLFLCGNDFHAVSDYRIYHEGGMAQARFDHPDGGFRGWGTLMPIRQGSRIRYYWMTFDRHLGSDFNWSYGNLYVFEAL